MKSKEERLTGNMKREKPEKSWDEVVKEDMKKKGSKGRIIKTNLS